MSLFVYAATRAVSRAVSPRYNRSERVNTYICLDELTALFSYSAHKAKHVHPLFHVHHVDHAVNDNERPSPPHPGTARNTNKKAQGLLCSKQPSVAIKQCVLKKNSVRQYLNSTKIIHSNRRAPSRRDILSLRQCRMMKTT